MTIGFVQRDQGFWAGVYDGGHAKDFADILRQIAKGEPVDFELPDGSIVKVGRLDAPPAKETP